jgi:hypothetical protein
MEGIGWAYRGYLANLSGVFLDPGRKSDFRIIISPVLENKADWEVF